jgi:hypothetical protein
MRTTIDIPDALGRQVKMRAAQEGRSLKTLITQAIERELGANAARTVPAATPSLPVIRSSRPGSLKITPAEISELLVREEAAAYAADVRH